MPRVIRVRMNEILFFSGSYEVVLSAEANQDVNVWFRASQDVTLFARSKDGDLLPLFTGKSLDQTYNFGPEVAALIFQAPKTNQGAVRVLANETNLKGKADSVPYKVPVQIDDNSLEMRVQRAIDARLGSLGVDTGPGRGHQYADYDDESEFDDEFGAGYAIDPEFEAAVDREVDDFRKRLLAAKDKRGAKPGRVDPDDSFAAKDGKPADDQSADGNNSASGKRDGKPSEG